jgi:predicted helicase
MRISLSGLSNDKGRQVSPAVCERAVRRVRERRGESAHSETTLRGIPPEAWAYKLGNRCAIDWVLDQHKEKKPKDPTIRERFDTYRLKDYKDKVIDLLARVTRVSVETVRIVGEMKAAGR